MKELRTAEDDFEDVTRKLQQLTVQVAAAQEAMRQSEAAYKAGTATNLSRITAQDQLLRAELSKTSAQFDQKIDYLRLLRVTGKLDTALSFSPLSAAQNGLMTTASNKILP